MVQKLKLAQKMVREELRRALARVAFHRLVRR